MPEPQSETEVVQREIRVEAAPETVFEFFTDPEKMVRWVGTGATLDPRPGGAFHLDTISGYYFSGEYVVVAPYRRIVFTWGYGDFPEPNPLPPGSSTVEVEFVPDGDATVVRLTHRVAADLADFHAMGWEHYLGRLAVAATGGEPGPDPFADAIDVMTGRDG